MLVTRNTLISLAFLTIACDPQPAPDECPEPEVIACEEPPPPPDIPSEAEFAVCHQVDTGLTKVFYPLGQECPDGWVFVCEWPQ